MALAHTALSSESTDSYQPRVLRAERIDARRVELIVTVGNGPYLALEWGERHDDAIPAFVRGTHFIASYNRRPGAWDIDAPDVPKDLRELTLRCCERLANAAGPCSLGPPPDVAPPVGTTEEDPAAIARLVDAVGQRIRSDLETGIFLNPEGWHLDEARSFRYWRLVADIRLSSAERNLGFLIFPTDPTESVYARTAHHDIVYYSDDIAIAQHHAELYQRDHATIDRFVSWFSTWDHELIQVD